MKLLLLLRKMAYRNHYNLGSNGGAVDKPHVLVVFCFLALGIARLLTAQQPPPPVIQGEVPEHVLFYMFFQSITPQPGDQKEREQFAAARLRNVAGVAHLQDDQVDTIRHFASACVSKVLAVDQKAQSLIAFGRSQRPNPNGSLAQAPSDLKFLQQERDNTITESISALREAIGKTAFASLQAALKPKPGLGRLRTPAR